MPPRTSLELRVHPSSRHERVAWDPWRRRWDVWCAPAARGGAANRRVIELCVGWLGVAPAEIELVGARSPDKRLRLRSLPIEEAERRLRACAERESA